MKAAPLFDALTALHIAVTAKHTDDFKIPHAMWMKLMQAEIGLRQALQEAALEVPIEDARTPALIGQGGES